MQAQPTGCALDLALARPGRPLATRVAARRFFSPYRFGMNASLSVVPVRSRRDEQILWRLTLSLARATPKERKTHKDGRTKKQQKRKKLADKRCILGPLSFSLSLSLSGCTLKARTPARRVGVARASEGEREKGWLAAAAPVVALAASRLTSVGRGCAHKRHRAPATRLGCWPRRSAVLPKRRSTTTRPRRRRRPVCHRTALFRALVGLRVVRRTADAVAGRRQQSARLRDRPAHVPADEEIGILEGPIVGSALALCLSVLPIKDFSTQLRRAYRRSSFSFCISFYFCTNKKQLRV